MPRNLSSDLITSLKGNQIRIVELVELHFSSAVYYTNAHIT